MLLVPFSVSFVVRSKPIDWFCVTVKDNVYDDLPDMLRDSICSGSWSNSVELSSSSSISLDSDESSRIYLPIAAQPLPGCKSDRQRGEKNTKA